MMTDYKSWLNAILHFNMPEYEKQKYTGIVLSLSKTNSPVILNVKHLALLVGIDYAMLKRMFYDRDKFYRSYYIKKRSGEDRLIEAPYPSLKMVQRWILDNILLPSARVHSSSVGFMPNKSIVDNASPHLKSSVLLKMDIRDFFPSISESLVNTYFCSLGYDNSLSRTLAYLCCKNGALPQGAPTSPMLSNVIFFDLDVALSRLSIDSDIIYTRYADDMTFSGSKISVTFIDCVSSVVNNYHFRINTAKTRRSGRNSRKIITGVSISSGKMTIPRERKREIRKKVYYILKYGVLGHLKHIESRDLLAGFRLLGELAYWHSVEPDNQYVMKSFSGIKDVLHM